MRSGTTTKAKDPIRASMRGTAMTESFTRSRVKLERVTSDEGEGPASVMLETSEEFIENVVMGDKTLLP